MKILLRHTRTGLYFQGPDRWIDNPDRACDFRFIDRALQYAAVWDLADVELAFAFEESLAVTTAPMHRASGRYASP